MSTVPRLFIDTALRAGETLTLGEAQAGYLLRVLRLGEGAPLSLFNGRDGEWRASLSVNGRGAAATLRIRTRCQPAPPHPALTLLFAPVKKDATDLIIEKATELGAARICPVITERTQTRTARLDRFRKIALEAAEQTERLDLPHICDLTTLDAGLEALPADTAIIFCDEDAAGSEAAERGRAEGEAVPMRSVLASLEGRAAAILTGPEGGFTPPERNFLRSWPGIVPVSLGPRVLRAETAAIAAMALWQSHCGDWR